MAVRKSERPTLAPAFDVAQFARDSDRYLTRVSEPFHAEEHPTKPSEVPSEVRIATRPFFAQVLTHEAWARSMVGAPVVVMTCEGLKRLPLDHRAGFVMSLMDGSIDLETIVELCGMDRDDALGLVRDLYESGVVDFK